MKIRNSHLKEVNEKYVEHMLCAQKYGLRMMLAGAACFIHGIFPNLFVTTASTTMHSLLNEINQRKQKETSGA